MSVGDLAARLVDALAAGAAGDLEVGCLPAGDGLPPHATFRDLNLVRADAMAYLADRTPWPLSSVGSGATNDARAVSAILEVAERIAIVQARADVVASSRNVGPDAVDPRELVLDRRGEEGDGLVAFAPDVEVDWVKARSLRDGSTRLLHRPTRGGRPGFLRNTTNGAAAGGGVDDATARGLLELIERDAVLLSWYARVPPRGRVSPDDPFRAELVAWLEHHGLAMSAYEVTTDVGVPVVMAVARQEPAGERLLATGGTIAGAGAGPTMAAAHARALLEVVQLVEVIIAVRHEGGSLRDLDPQIALYAAEDRRQAFAYLDQSPRAHDGPEPMPPVSTHGVLVEALARCGVEAFAIDRTPPWLARLDVAIVETHAPGLQPLALGTATRGRRLASPRLERALAALGRAASDIHPEPHPLG